MKKLLLMVSAIAAGFTSVAQADISISGSAGLGYVSGNTNVSDVYTGGAISFALSSTLDNGVTVSTSAGIRMDTNDTKSTSTSGSGVDVDSSVTGTQTALKSVYQLATGFTAITFTGGNNSVTWGMDVGLAGEGAGSVGGVASDLVDEGGYARDYSAGLTQDSGGGIAFSTTLGDAAVSLSYLVQTPSQLESSNEIRFGDSADTTMTGISVSMPMGDLAISAGYANVENTDTQTGASIAYAVGGGTLTVGYTDVDNNSGSDESAWGATYSTSLGAATLKVGVNSAKVGSNTGTLTEAQISQSLGGGASLYAEIQTSSDTTGSTTTDGTNLAIDLDPAPCATTLRPTHSPKGFSMFTRSLLLGSTALVFTATSALADLKAQDVWMDWKDYIQGFGYTVQGSEATSGDTLTISGLKLSVPIPEQSGSVDLGMGEMSFSNLSDGTVEISLPDTFPITFDVVSGGETEVAGTLNYDTTDLSIIVSGSPDDMNYITTASTLDMSLADLMVEGKPLDIGTVAFNMTGLAGASNMKLGNIRNIMQSFSVDKLSYTLDINSPEEADGLEAFKMIGALNALSFNGTGAYPNAGGFDAQDVSAMLKAGFAFDGGFAYADGSTTFEITESGGQTVGVSSSETGLLKVAMSEAGLHYGAEATGLKSNMTGTQVPFPIELTAEKSALSLTMPISASENAQDFGLTVQLANFTTSEMLWALFDPTGQLPRDPATLHLELSGKATLLFDMMDPESITGVETGAQNPGEVNSIDINALELTAAGASLTGTGAFEIDNSDTQTFSGMPKPVGAVDLKLVGGNGLIDKLVAMGLLPEDQAMGARMMMGLFTIPSGTPDTLTSKIEVNDQGHVLANGQRLR